MRLRENVNKNIFLVYSNLLKIGLLRIVSGPMLKDIGLEYVILGNSERRQYFAETDETVNKKVHSVFNYGMTPIMCCGETLTHIELGGTTDQVRQIVIAYEPIWAIGTGKTASNEQAEEVCAIVRDCVKELYGSEVAEATRVLYGGSVTAASAHDLFNMPNIDGGLVGGASLKSDDLEKIAKYNG